MKIKNAAVMSAATAMVTLPLFVTPQVIIAQEAEGDAGETVLDVAAVSDGVSSAEEVVTDVAGATGDAQVETAEDAVVVADEAVASYQEAVAEDETPAQTTASKKAEQTSTAETDSIAISEQQEESLSAQAAKDEDASVAVLDANSTSDGEAQATQAIANGLYEIALFSDTNKVLDVDGASNDNGAKVQVYESNTTAAQRWQVSFGSDGYYTIKSVTSGKYLDVTGASVENGTQIQQYDGNSTLAQMWVIEEDSARSGYYLIRSALNTSYVLDISGGSTDNGAKVQLYQENATAAQSFLFKAIVQLVDDGVYTLTNSNSSKVLDIDGASLADGGNAQQYAGNSTNAQRYGFQYDSSTGYYTVVNAQSGKVLDVTGANTDEGANVQQYTYNGTRAQQWSVYSNSDGSFTLRSALNGFALDVTGASLDNGANVQTWSNNGTGAQKWNLTEVSDWLAAGTYEIVAANNTGNALKTSTASYGASNVAAASRNASNPSHLWQLVWESDGYCRLVNIGSGLALDVSGASTTAGASIQQYAANGTSAQKWKPVLSIGGVKLVSKLSPNLVVDIPGNSTSAGTEIKTYTSNDTTAQRFLFVPTPILESGSSYYLRLLDDVDKAVDDPGASTNEGQSLWVYTFNGTNAQTFYVEDAGGGAYRLVNIAAGKNLSMDASGNVTLSSSGDSSSSWYVSFNERTNSVKLVNVSTGKALTVGGTSNESSVKGVTVADGDSSQGYLPQKAVITGNTLNGIDISSWQAGIDLEAVEADFVIVKATQGTYYTNEYFYDWAEQTLSMGRQLGLYHFVTSFDSPVDQAYYFVETVRDFVGRAALFLDWEDTDGSNAVEQGVEFAKTFLDTVYNLTGVKPLIYTSRNVVIGYDWTSVADAGYGLWMAQWLYANIDAIDNDYLDDPELYLSYNGTDGFGAWDYPTIYQYVGTDGRLSGYSGSLDLNKFYGTVGDWQNLC